VPYSTCNEAHNNIICPYILQNELKHFVHDMWEGQVYQNIIDALNYLDEIDDGDGLFNFTQVLQMEALFPMTMYPLFRLQVSMAFF